MPAAGRAVLLEELVVDLTAELHPRHVADAASIRPAVALDDDVLELLERRSAARGW